MNLARPWWHYLLIGMACVFLFRSRLDDAMPFGDQMAPLRGLALFVLVFFLWLWRERN